jgi:hypothetical protein
VHNAACHKCTAHDQQQVADDAAQQSELYYSQQSAAAAAAAAAAAVQVDWRSRLLVMLPSKVSFTTRSNLRQQQRNGHSSSRCYKPMRLQPKLNAENHVQDVCCLATRRTIPPKARVSTNIRKEKEHQDGLQHECQSARVPMLKTIIQAHSSQLTPS